MNDQRTLPPRWAASSNSGEFATLSGARGVYSGSGIGPGSVLLNRYRILSELGQGGMGIVYRCFDEVAGIEVALKALPSELSRNSLEMEYIRENFQLVAKLVHQNIAINRMLERDPASGDCYLIMECVDGEDLRRWMRRKFRNQPLPIETVLHIIRQVAAALDYAHEQKVMHRDIKPGNIMITPAGTIKILDFGLAAQIRSSMSRESMAYTGISGTAPYMAPEQWRGRPQGAAADQYALGVMTYELLAGHLPFDSSDTAVLKRAVLDEKAEPVPGISKRAQLAIDRAMSKAPGDRFDKCADFVAALERGKRKPKRWAWAKWLAAGAAAVLFIGAVAAGANWFIGKRQEGIRQEENVRRQRELRITREKAERAKQQSARSQELQQKCNARIMALKVVADKIQTFMYSSGEAFKKHGETLQRNFEAASEAYDAAMYTAVSKHLDEAEKASAWIAENLLPAEKAAGLASKAEQEKTRADAVESSKHAALTYKEASAAREKALKAFDAGDFNSAINNFRQAVEGYQNALRQAGEQACRNLIAEAEAARDKKQWQKLKAIAEKIYPLNKEKAQSFLALAQSKMHVQNLYARGRAAADSGKLEFALQCLEEIRKVKKGDPGVEVLYKAIVERSIAENNLLQEKLQSFKDTFDESGCDRGQTFGKKIDTFKNRFAAGEKKKAKDPIGAFRLFKEAEAAAVWIEKSIPLRLKSEQLIEKVVAKREESDRFMASDIAVKEYEEASIAFRQGDNEYNSGNFPAAVEKFNIAFAGFEAAWNKAVKVYGDKEFASAQRAVAQKNWGVLKSIATRLRAVNDERAEFFLQLAENGKNIEKWLSEAKECADNGDVKKAAELLDKILEVKKDHYEALALKKEIERKQMRGVKIIVFDGSREVAAEVRLEGVEPFTSGKIFNGLRKNQRYQGKVSYQGKVRTIDFVCAWEGVSTRKYFLDRLGVARKFPLPGGNVLKMLRIPAGSFSMGSPLEGEPGRSNMESLRSVVLTSDFWMGETEVTQEQFRAVMNRDPSWNKGPGRPVESVTWEEARRFCRRLNRLCRKMLPPGYEFALPTEAQWEYACRAGTKTPLNSGRGLVALDERCYNLDDVAWYKHNTSGPMGVGRKNPNSWGLYDMHGNVAEWCQDYYTFYPSGDSVDPEGPGSGRYRVYRGGSWKSEPVSCRSAARAGGEPVSEHYEDVGFRVVLAPLRFQN